MPKTTEINTTCAVCGGTWGEPLGGLDGQNCPADCHDESKWKALAELEKDRERLDFLGRRHAELSFHGVEAEYVEGGSICKDRWRVDCGVRIDAKAGTRTEMKTERYGLREAIDAAQEEKPDE